MFDLAVILPASIPSPSESVWYLGPIPLRAYGICILIGILVAIYLGQRRYAERGGDTELLYAVAIWVIPAGIIGGRLYEIFTSPQRYFPPTGDPLLMVQVWKGGMGIMGAVLLGALVAFITVRRAGQRLGPFADALAPGVLIAQAIGRIGNYFNQELFGLPTTLPWGLEIDDAHLPVQYASGSLFHPTFLYELIWNLLGAAFLIWFDYWRKNKVASGQIMWLYVAIYGLGRAWVEHLRIDEPAHWVGPLRLASWFGLGMVLLGLVGYWWAGRLGAATKLTKTEVEHWQNAAEEAESKQK
ncbi:prolipoprotein diacylglyceryl transferase [Boudabousia marimammalium]|uniref:Phosphatidylglycerol--prolipoprotein diacylglyceryl transferase n=1 Tax=Boudabousia marimammalium TaxID=156892 RepID=A0A1Q5PRB6_9ACTO|nr:prolipoprotein diacylglyceryl transferase [Boudabousia marimammalium]OKL50039.1 prolipoprotein diacylglyceryl transferase [Boudabousia marimammalium]